MDISHYKENWEYVDSRIRRTLVLYNGRLHYCRGVDGEGYANLSTLKNGFGFNVLAGDIDLTSPTLGYFDYKQHAVYSFRTPARHYKQGLCPENIRNDSNLPSYILMEMDGLNQPVTNSYHNSFKRVEELMCGELNSVALSRNFAIDREHLRYRGFYVGTWRVNQDNGIIIPALDPDYNFLEENMHEEVQNV